MLDAIRVIVQGHSKIETTETTVNTLTAYSVAARDRWQQIIEELPASRPRAHAAWPLRD